MSNPKTAIVYASVFAAFLPPATTFMFNLILVGLVFFIEAGWYSLVAVALDTEERMKTATVHASSRWYVALVIYRG